MAHMKGLQDRHSVPNAPQEREFREEGGMHRPSCGAATKCPPGTLQLEQSEFVRFSLVFLSDFGFEESGYRL